MAKAIYFPIQTNKRTPEEQVQSLLKLKSQDIHLLKSIVDMNRYHNIKDIEKTEQFKKCLKLAEKIVPPLPSDLKWDKDSASSKKPVLVSQPHPLDAKHQIITHQPPQKTVIYGTHPLETKPSTSTTSTTTAKTKTISTGHLGKYEQDQASADDKIKELRKKIRAKDFKGTSGMEKAI